jgi:hypothetical protein
MLAGFRSIGAAPSQEIAAMPRQMHLMAYLKTGPSAMHSGGWRHPHAALCDIFNPTRYAHIARVLEEARFDGCFYADTQGIPDIYEGNPAPTFSMAGSFPTSTR